MKGRGLQTQLTLAAIRQSFSLRANRHIGSSFVGWFSRQLENRNHVAYVRFTRDDNVSGGRRLGGGVDEQVQI